LAREKYFIPEILQPTRPTYEYVESTHSDVVVDIFVQILREIFLSHPIYTYVPREDSFGPDYESTKIVITDHYTEEALFLPVVTTGINNVNTKWIQFSQNPFNTVLKPDMNSDGSIKRDSAGKMIPSHYEYVGGYEGSITLLISGRDTLEREELSNLLHVFCADVLRDQLYVRGIHVKNVQAGGFTTAEYRNTFIFQVPLNIEFYSEWRRVIPVGETLKSIGMNMNVIGGLENLESPEEVVAEKIPVYDQKNQYYVIDGATNEPFIPELILSATSVDAPITLTFKTNTVRWEVSDFWRKALKETLIPFENYQIELNKENPIQTYLKNAAKGILEAEKLRALSLTQGRIIADGTKVIGNAFIYGDGKVELKDYPNDPIEIYSTTVLPDNTVEVRNTSRNKNKAILVAKGVVIDINDNINGQIYKRVLNKYTQLPEDVLLSSTDQIFLDGENYNTMTAVDLFMIMQFSNEQPFRYSINQIIDEIDKLVIQLGDMSISIVNRTQKLSNITSIKQELIARTERFLLKQPLGL